MRKEKALINLLRGLVDLLTEEADRNSSFAGKLEALFAPLPDKPAWTKKSGTKKITVATPDIYVERKVRGEDEFRLWLRDQPVDVMRAVIKQHDFDPARRTSRWRDAEKISAFIADRLEERLSRGSSFMRTDAAR
jgi:hypothetical protein